MKSFRENHVVRNESRDKCWGIPTLRGGWKKDLLRRRLKTSSHDLKIETKRMNGVMEDKGEKVSERRNSTLIKNCYRLSSFFFQMDEQLQCVSQPPFQAVDGQWNKRRSEILRISPPLLSRANNTHSPPHSVLCSCQRQRSSWGLLSPQEMVEPWMKGA